MCGKTREKLLLQSDNLTLGRALEISLQVEAAVECTTLLAGGARCLADVPAQPQPAYHAHDSAHSADDSQCSEAGFPVQLIQRQNNRHTSEVCGNCGSRSHNSKAQLCPARGTMQKLYEAKSFCQDVPFRPSRCLPTHGTAACSPQPHRDQKCDCWSDGFQKNLLCS